MYHRIIFDEKTIKGIQEAINDAINKTHNEGRKTFHGDSGGVYSLQRVNGKLVKEYLHNEQPDQQPAPEQESKEQTGRGR